MKKLKELTLKEHTDLKNYRLLCIVFPEATGDFREDCGADIRKPEKKVCTQTGGCLSNWTCKTCCFYKPKPKQPTHEETLQRVKKELNIQIDTKISDMKKSIIWYMNNLYDSLESATIPPEAE